MTALAALATALAPAAASAHDRWPAPGRLYVDVGGGMERVNLPEITGYSDASDQQFGGIDDEFWRWSAEVALGYADREGLSLPDPIGQNARIEARLRYSAGKSDNEEHNSSVGLVRLDRTNSKTFFFQPLPTSPIPRALSNTALETWDAELTYQTDVVLSDAFALTPLVGVTYTRMTLDNDFKATADTGSTIETNDTTRTHYYGGMLGTDLVFRPAQGLALDLGLRADLLGASASMKAHQNAFARSHQSADDTSFAARATVSSGVTAELGPLQLRVEGFARYLSYLAVPDHPTYIGDTGSNIDSEKMWSAGGKASLTIWFP